MDIGRFARNGELGKARAAAPAPHEGTATEKPGHALFDCVDIDAGARQLAAQRFVIFIQRLKPLGVMFGDQIGGNRQLLMKSSPKPEFSA
jgi:hypothetical protein